MHASSPLTLEDIQPNTCDKGKRILRSITKEVQNFLNDDMDMNPKVDILNPKDNDLDQLIEKFIQVSSFDNINYTTNS